jgi:hypothetical protein
LLDEFFCLLAGKGKRKHAEAFDFDLRQRDLHRVTNKKIGSSGKFAPEVKTRYE